MNFVALKERFDDIGIPFPEHLCLYEGTVILVVRREGKDDFTIMFYEPVSLWQDVLLDIMD